MPGRKRFLETPWCVLAVAAAFALAAILHLSDSAASAVVPFQLASGWSVTARPYRGQSALMSDANARVEPDHSWETSVQAAGSGGESSATCEHWAVQWGPHPLERKARRSDLPGEDAHAWDERYLTELGAFDRFVRRDCNGWPAPYPGEP